MIHYLWLIPTAIVMYLGYAWLSKQSQDIGGVYFWILALCPTPIWAIVTKVSNNLLVDAVIYAVVLWVSFAGGLILFGAASGFTVLQYVGLAIAIFGIVLMKI